MILSKTAIVKIHCNTAKYYEDKGYVIPRHKDKWSDEYLITRGAEIEVLVSDLTPKSTALVLWKCCDCQKEEMRIFYHCKDKVRCNECALKMTNLAEKSRWWKGGISIKYCIDCKKRILKPRNIKTSRCSDCHKKHLEKQKKYCIDCGEKIERRASRCCKCYHIWASGSNNHMFNPNLTEQDRQEQRYFPKLGQWRDNVLNRDNCTCQCCGKKGIVHNSIVKEQLHAHHINSFKENKELRIDITNGITLCLQCHMKLHSKYGKKTSNKELTLFLMEYKNG